MVVFLEYELECADEQNLTPRTEAAPSRYENF